MQTFHLRKTNKSLESWTFNIHQTKEGLLLHWLFSWLLRWPQSMLRNFIFVLQSTHHLWPHFFLQAASDNQRGCRDVPTAALPQVSHCWAISHPHRACWDHGFELLQGQFRLDIWKKHSTWHTDRVMECPAQSPTPNKARIKTHFGSWALPGPVRQRSHGFVPWHCLGLRKSKHF